MTLSKLTKKVLIKLRQDHFALKFSEKFRILLNRVKLSSQRPSASVSQTKPSLLWELKITVEVNFFWILYPLTKRYRFREHLASGL